MIPKLKIWVENKILAVIYFLQNLLISNLMQIYISPVNTYFIHVYLFDHLAVEPLLFHS